MHDRGKVLVQAMLMLTGGGEACADIERLRSQAALFGSVPSDSTLYRTFRSISSETLSGLWEAMAAWPSGTRLIVRREPLHPGAQHSLSPRRCSATSASSTTLSGGFIAGIIAVPDMGRPGPPARPRLDAGGWAFRLAIA